MDEKVKKIELNLSKMEYKLTINLTIRRLIVR